MLRLGARMTIGLKTQDAPALDRWIPYVYYQSEVMRYLEVTALAGAAFAYPEPRLAITEADLREAAGLVPVGARPLATLHPGASDPRRRWPPGSFAAVGDALAGAGAQVVLTGVEAERDVVEAVVGAMRAPVYDLCGRLSVGGLAGLLSRCAVVVSNDTGPRHLAAAVGAATVGIYWCGNVINAGPMTRTRHRPAISWRLHCPVCGVRCIESRCDHREPFVADVPVAEVVAWALDLLSG